MSARWQEVERLYGECYRLSMGERLEFLRNRCPAELQSELQALLEQQASDDATETLHPSTVTQLGPERQLGPYRLEVSLGAGGMGEVFRALDTRLHRRVALKLLPLEKSKVGVNRRRLLQEARAASTLNHVNIVTIYDIASDHDVDFLVMELIQGQTLKDLMNGGSMEIRLIASLAVQIACALSAAHAAGITHRDIKPGNIMVTAEQIVKVLDFGIAKLAKDTLATELTVPGTLMGTVAYMSPEQARGEQVSGKSDIFSLGTVLYQVATGKLPFSGINSMAVLHRIIHDIPVRPSTIREAVPPALDDLIARCLQKEPEHRPSALEMVEELKRLAEPRIHSSRVDTGQPSIAVLPFRFRNAAAEDQFLSVALADALNHRLNSTGKLLVRPTGAVMRYAGKDTEWTQVARDLNTDLVIEGTIQKLGPKIRVMVQVFRARDSHTLHSVKQDGDMEDLFGLQDRLSDAVAETFVPREAVATESGYVPTSNPMAYELYLRGVDRAAFWNRQDLQSGIDSFSRATALDPNFADAWARLAQTCHTMFHFDGDPQWFERAETAISRALELNPIHADALCARAQSLFSPHRRFQNIAALRSVSAALRINPHCQPAMLWRGTLDYHYGFYEQGQHWIQEYLRVNPHAPMGWHLTAQMALEVGDYEKAREAWERTLLYDPQMLHANIFVPLLPLTLGKIEEARSLMGRAKKLFPDEPQVAAIGAMLLAYGGDAPMAERQAEEAGNSTKSLMHSHHAWHYAASTFALCGESDKAVVQLRRCAELGMPNYRLFTTDPHLKSLHGHAGFQSFLTDLRRQNDVLRAEVESGT